MNLKQLRTFFSDKTILLTGHTGFKGSWMVSVLNYLGARVYGLSLAAETNSLYQLMNGDQLCNTTIGDINDLTLVNKSIQAVQPDIIFHFAAQALVIEGYKSPVETFKTNAIGSANILEGLRALNKKCTVIMITTDKVYDNKEWVYPYREVDPLGGYDPYSASKACAEIVIQSYRSSFFNPLDYDTHRKSIASCRAGNVIGGGDYAANRIIPDIVRAMELKQAVKLRNPNAVRPWQHVLEALYGYILLAYKMDEDPVKFAQSYNFGPLYDESVTVQQLVDIALEAWGKGTYEHQQQEHQQHEANLLRLDCSKACNLLQWKPVWNAQQAIEKTMQWYKKISTGENTPREMCHEQIQAYFSDFSQ